MLIWQCLTWLGTEIDFNLKVWKPLPDHQLLLCATETVFLVWNHLSFENFKLCRLKNYLPDAGSMTSYDETLLCTPLITKIFFKLRYVILKSTAYFLFQYPYFILCKVQVNSFLEDIIILCNPQKIWKINVMDTFGPGCQMMDWIFLFC